MNGTGGGPEPVAPRRFRLRWWMWAVAFLLLVVIAVFAVRAEGFRSFARVQADIAARGLPTDPLTLVAGFPAIPDAERQRRYRMIERRIRTWPDIRNATPPHDPCTARPDPLIDAARASFLAAGDADADAMAALLDEGPVLATLPGFITRDPPTMRKGSLASDWWDAAPWLLSQRSLAMHAALRCIRDADPRLGLHRLRQLEATLDRPGCLIDEMIRLAVSSVADDARLWLAVRGRLPSDELSDWLATPDPWRQRMADAWAGERCLTWSMYTQSVGASTGSPSSPGTTLWDRCEDAWYGACAWMLLGHECAVGASRVANIELALRGQAPIATASFPMVLAASSRAGASIPNLQESLVTAAELAYSRRLKQVLAAIASRRGGAPLPMTEAEFGADLQPILATGATPDEPAITYEHLGPARLRLGLGASTPRPPLVPADRWRPAYAGPAGQPPAIKPWIGGRWWLEADLDAILQPPPPPPLKRPPPPRPTRARKPTAPAPPATPSTPAP